MSELGRGREDGQIDMSGEVDMNVTEFGNEIVVSGSGIWNVCLVSSSTICF